MSGSASPRDGDIVVRQDRRDRRNVYVVPIVSRGQYVFRRRDDALVQGMSCARRRGVTAWLRTDAHDCVQLNDFGTTQSRGCAPSRRARDDSRASVSGPYSGNSMMSSRSSISLRESILQRICGEYREMPGLQLTLGQAQRLWGLDEETCARSLDFLVERGFLVRTSRGVYARLTEGPVASPTLRMAKGSTDGARAGGLERARAS
jgi:hypothetical protein